MKVVFACAGTGGRINPAIAIANIIKSKKTAQNRLLKINSKPFLF